jgi:hypothetical protein
LKEMAPKSLGSTPTAHILGGKSDYLYEESVQLSNICAKDSRVVFEHSEGHTIPRRPDLTTGMARVVRQAIDLALLKT